MKGKELIDEAISGKLGNCIITGCSVDGSDATLFRGVYVSPCGKFWSTTPWKKKRKRGYIKAKKPFRQMTDFKSGV